jgi:hypothetical protein
VTASQWLASAPADLVALMRRMTWHHKVNWNAPDYIEADEFGTDAEGKPKGDGREVVDDIEKAEALSSQVPASHLTLPDDPPEAREHVIAVDIDCPAWLIPSSTEGHHHLYARTTQPILWADYVKWLDASVVIGLLEPGYVSACKSRGMTSLRAPWVRKGAEHEGVAQ